MSQGQAGEDWAAQRREAADVKADALRRSQQAEASQAGQMLRDFVAQATSAGLPSTQLFARAYSGSARYRTDAHGWYLKRDGSVAVGLEGQYYVLKVPKSFRSRLHGVHIEASPAPLIVGKGARDGESIDLKDLIALRLAAGTSWSLSA